MQCDTKLSRCHVVCYSAGYDLLQNLQIPKSGGGEYKIRCMISAYNAESTEARCYMEFVEKVRQKKLEDCMTTMGAKLAGPPTTFSANQIGKKSSYDNECAASLFSVHQDSNKPGWTLVERGTPSVEPREMVQARAGDAVARDNENLVVERRVMLEDSGDCCRAGKRNRSEVVAQWFNELESNNDVLEAKVNKLEAEKLELATKNGALEEQTLVMQREKAGLLMTIKTLEAGALEDKAYKTEAACRIRELETKMQNWHIQEVGLQAKIQSLEAREWKVSERNKMIAAVSTAAESTLRVAEEAAAKARRQLAQCAALATPVEVCLQDTVSDLLECLE